MKKLVIALFLAAGLFALFYLRPGQSMPNGEARVDDAVPAHVEPEPVAVSPDAAASVPAAPPRSKSTGSSRPATVSTGPEMRTGLVRGRSSWAVEVEPGAAPAEEAFRAFLPEAADAMGLKSPDFAEAELVDQVTSRHNGVTHSYLHQNHLGIRVLHAVMNINTLPDGRVLSMGSGFIRDVASRVNAVQPLMTAEEALQAALNHLYLAVPVKPTLLASETGASQKHIFSRSGVASREIPVELQYLPQPGGTVALVWGVQVDLRDGTHYWDMKVDAVTGSILAKDDWVVNEAYQVYAQPKISPHDGTRTLELDPYLHAPGTASPFGWHDTNGMAGAEFTITRGNNVHAYTDVDANNISDGTEPDGGAGLVFSNEVDLAQEPSSYGEAAQVNLFYWNNLCHDIFHAYGFDEASGNFQDNNYGNGGAGGDHVHAEAQDGSGFNNANFLTLPDGSNPRMQMYLGNNVSPMRDGDLDNLVIVHEYGHGVSIRLTGGASETSCLNSDQSRGMGEGWSDWLGLVLTAKLGDGPNDPRAVGMWLFGEDADGPGIRDYPYTTNMTVNPFRYEDIDGVVVPHGVGTVWCTALWDMYWNLVDDHGFDPDIYEGTGGNNLALQLVIDGLKLQPCNPTFLDARDAILMADEINNNGANQEAIWTAFARRGMGLSAYDGGSAGVLVVSNAFDLPNFGMRVVNSEPARGEVVFATPTNFTVTFSDAYDPATVEASDLAVNGVFADAVEQTTTQQLTFSFVSTPVTNEGVQQYSMPSNVIIRTSDGNGVDAWSDTFRYDATPLEVTHANPATGSVKQLPMTSLVLYFSEPIDGGSVSESDLQLSQGFAAGVFQLDPTTLIFTVSGIDLESDLQLDVPAGALLDVYGNPSIGFSGVVGLDFGTVVLPSTWTAQEPLGSMIYHAGVSGAVSDPSDQDAFTLNIDSGQVLSVTMMTDTSLTLSGELQLEGSGGMVLGTTTGAAGEAVFLQTIPIETNDTYTLTVSSAASNTGRYTVDLLLNAFSEEESLGRSTNDLAADAELLDSAELAAGFPGLKRTAAGGRAQFPGLEQPASFYDETFDTGAGGFAFDNGFGSGNGLWHLSTGRNTDGLPGHSPPGSLYYGFFEDDEGGGTYDTGQANGGAAYSPSIKLPPGGGVTLHFTYLLETEGLSFYDVCGVAVGVDGVYETLLTTSDGSLPLSTTGAWLSASADLSSYAGQDIQLRFSFDTIDGLINDQEGWYVDDLLIEHAAFSNGIMDHLQFSVESGTVFSVMLSSLDDDSLVLDLLEEGIETVSGSPTRDIQQVIDRMVAPAGRSYTARIRGDGRYNLVVAEGAVFDREPNDEPIYAQDIVLAEHALGYIGPNDHDWYNLPVTTGDVITALTSLLSTNGAAFENRLNPGLDLYDPVGIPVVTNLDGAADGRNAWLVHTAMVEGVYSLHVFGESNTVGEYSLQVGGILGLTSSFEVVSIVPGDGEQLPASPASVELGFSHPVRQDGVGLDDLLIDGVIAPTGFAVLAADRVRYEIPSLGEGTHTVSVAEGVVANLFGQPLNTFTSTFIIDLTGPRLTGSSLSEGDVVPVGDLDMVFTFDSRLGESLDAADVVLTGLLTGARAPDFFSHDATAQQVSVTYSNLGDDRFYLALLSGALRFEDDVGLALDGEPLAFPFPPNVSGNGVPGGDFTVSFVADSIVENYPAMQGKLPFGSMIYDPPVRGLLHDAGDIDNYALLLDSNQLLTAVLRPLDEGLQVKVSLWGLGLDFYAGASAPGAGLDGLMAAAPVPSNAIYVVSVGGTNGTQGAYELDLVLNALVEEERLGMASNQTPGSAQSLDPGWVPLGTNVTRTAVMGAVDEDDAYDCYRFAAQAEQAFSLVAVSDSGTLSAVLYESDGITVVRTSVPSDQADAVIGDHISATGQTWYACVSSTVQTPYNLLVTRGAEFEVEMNDDVGRAQDISQSGKVIGGLEQAPQLEEEIEPNDDGGPPETLDDLPFANDWSGSFMEIAANQYTAAVRGVISEGNDVDIDFFLVYAEPGDVLAVDLYGASSGGGDLQDTVLGIFDTNAALIAYNDDGGLGLDSSLVFSDFLYKGPYYVAADSYGALTGSYTLLATHTATNRQYTLSYDLFTLPMTTGTVMTVRTWTPGDGPFAFDNFLDPAVEVLGPSQTIQAQGFSGAGDAHNVLLVYTASMDGVYTVRLGAESGFPGEYLLEVSGYQPDSDGDGLPDAWEISKGLNHLAGWGSQGGSGDPDGDLSDNTGEYQAGTQPLDGASVFEARAISEQGLLPGFSLTVRTEPGQRYTVQFTDGFPPDTSPWQDFANPANGIGTWTETNSSPGSYIFTDRFDGDTSLSNSASGRRMYRFEVERP